MTTAAPDRKSLLRALGGVLAFGVVGFWLHTARRTLFRPSGIARWAEPVSTEQSMVFLPNTQSDFDYGIKDGIPLNEEIALCIAIRDQPEDLIEWLVHHHHHMGINRFYIQDDGSDPPLSTMTYPGVPQSILTFNYYDVASRPGSSRQGQTYSDCLSDYGSYHTWMGFFDVDEFIEVVREDESLRDVLATFDGNDTVGSLALNWVTHSSNGLLEPVSEVRKSYTTCLTDDIPETYDNEWEPLPNNWEMKSFIKTALATNSRTPHQFNLLEGSWNVGEDGDAILNIDKFWRKPTYHRIRLHHYALKSKAEFAAKLAKWKGETVRGWEHWERIEDTTLHVECKKMTRYSP